MTKEELIQLAKNIMNAIGKDEEENNEMLMIFLDNIPSPNASDLFFSLEYDRLTAEEIVERALSYRPFQL